LSNARINFLNVVIKQRLHAKSKSAGGLLDQRPDKTQEGLMLWAMPAMREKIPDRHV
jgi:hypothetical protein